MIVLRTTAIPTPGHTPPSLGLCGLVLVDDPFSAYGVHVISQDRHPADPRAGALRGEDLVPRALGNHHSLELGEGSRNLLREPPHGADRVKPLGHRDEAHGVRVEKPYYAGKVQGGTG